MKRLLKVMRYTRNELHRLPRVGPCVGAVGLEGSPGEIVNSLGKHKEFQGRACGQYQCIFTLDWNTGLCFSVCALMVTGAKGEYDLNFLVQNIDTDHSGGSPILEIESDIGV